MKKLLIAMMALTLVMGFSLPVFATATSGVITLGNAGGTYDNAEYGLSNNVWMDYTVGNNYQDYALGDKHRSGNREYFTTNQTTLIYYYESDDYKGDTTLNNSLPSAGATVISGTAL